MIYDYVLSTKANYVIVFIWKEILFELTIQFVLFLSFLFSFSIGFRINSAIVVDGIVLFLVLVFLESDRNFLWLLIISEICVFLEGLYCWDFLVRKKREFLRSF